MNEKQKIKNELEMARNAVKAAGLYLVSKNEIDKLGDVATDAYENYPLHNWFFGGTYNPKGSKILMETSLKSMIDDGVIYADSPEINGFTVWMPPKYTGNTPTKNAKNAYTYEFVGWSPKLGPVTKETYYTAVFDSAKATGIQDVHLAGLNVSVSAVSRNIQVSAAPVGSAYAILDMQGRVLKKGRVESPNFSIMMPQAGTYFVRIGSYVQRISIK